MNCVEVDDYLASVGSKLRSAFGEEVLPGSMRNVKWTCSCGKTCFKPVHEVLRKDVRRVKSCGSCNRIDDKRAMQKLIKSESHLLPAFLGEINAGSSHVKVKWLCSCGQTHEATPYNVLTGKTVSCGKCGMIEAAEANRKLKEIESGWRLLSSAPINANSHAKNKFECACGKMALVSTASVMNGRSKSCGKCGQLSAGAVNAKLEEMKSKLRVNSTSTMSVGSTVKTRFACACGGSNMTYPYSVMSGNTRSCGHCLENLRKWACKVSENLTSAAYPMDHSSFPSGGPNPLEQVKSRIHRFKASCVLCGTHYETSVALIARGKKLTCGCTNGTSSLGQAEIHAYIVSTGIKAELEFKVNNMSYDIGIPSKQLLIEYDGLRWHSMPEARKRDAAKNKNAMINGYKVMRIFEDEWILKTRQMKALISSRIGVSKTISIRPKKCRLAAINAAAADSFYDKTHYIGSCNARVNYGAFVNNELVCCASFKKPTRQSKWDWELSRMASTGDLKIHGIWSKILKKFIEDHCPKTIVSFSDNRLFTGRTYERIGFSHDGNVKPDYYWTKHGARFHKSRLRKTFQEKDSGLTESQLREAQGYKKIWDTGKSRWLLRIV